MIGQVDQHLMQLAGVVAHRFGLRDFDLELQSATDNEVFLVTARDGGRDRRYALRLQWYEGLDLDAVTAELLWLEALNRDTAVVVPAPVAAPDGARVVEVFDPRHGETRPCTLLEWVDGEFIVQALTPGHLSSVGTVMAQLHDHAAGNARALGLDRRRQAFRGNPEDLLDPDICLRLGYECSILDDVARALSCIREATAGIGEGEAQFGFLHGDLHQWNYLFRGGHVAVIDFEDCGWGHFSYDIAVTLSYFRFPLPGLAASAPFEAFYDAFAAGYERVRTLPSGVGACLRRVYGRPAAGDGQLHARRHVQLRRPAGRTRLPGAAPRAPA